MVTQLLDFLDIVQCTFRRHSWAKVVLNEFIHNIYCVARARILGVLFAFAWKKSSISKHASWAAESPNYRGSRTQSQVVTVGCLEAFANAIQCELFSSFLAKAQMLGRRR